MKNLVINEFKSITKGKKNLWYIKEATKNNYSCRSRETGNILFFYTNRGNLKLNPEFFSLVPEKDYQPLKNEIEKSFPELKRLFTHNSPKIMLMNSPDLAKRNYSKY